MVEVAQLSDIVAKLKINNIRPSVIRTRVMQYLLENRVHPSADKIYLELSKDIPTLSKASIYNTLKTLKNKQLILEIGIDENELRYDGYTHAHGHFQCTKCDKLEDFDISCDICSAKGIEGSLILDSQIYHKGICPSCNK